jgi:hypothetical protein
MHLDRTEETNLMRCLSICKHHCDPEKVESATQEQREVRVRKIASGLEKSMEQINKIHALAESTGNIELLRLLNGQFKFGAYVRK